MKCLFAGPSLYGAAFDPGDVQLRGPVEMGAIEHAVGEGATAIGIVDGHYQQIGAVWHKEILFALASGVAVYGAASMGALRAAECEPFGMIPVGHIAQLYCAGALFDDADVAITNGPAELGFPPLTEAMVDVEASLARLHAASRISAEQEDAIRAAARALFFADRTIEAIFAGFEPQLLDLYQSHRVSQKRADALALVETLKALPAARAAPPPRDWVFANSPFWSSRAPPRSSSVTAL